MAIAAVTGGSGNDSTGAATSKALSTFTLSAGQAVVVGVALGSTASSVTSITDTKGSTYTLKRAKNGTGVRTEMWTAPSGGAQAGNAVTVNFSPATTMAGTVEVYSGVGSAGNQGDGTDSSTYVQAAAATQDGNNFVVAALGFVCQSGDTLTASLGTSRQSSIPAATAVGVALYDNTSLGNATLTDQARISTSRQWAAVALELRVSGGTSTPYADYAATAAPSLQASKEFRLVSAREPLFCVNAGSAVNPYIVDSQLPQCYVSVAYSQLLSAGGGTGPYTFAVTSGSLPSGLSLNSSGVFSGSTTSVANFTFTVTVTDSRAHTGSQTFTISVVATTPSTTPIINQVINIYQGESCQDSTQ